MQVNYICRFHCSEPDRTDKDGADGAARTPHYFKLRSATVAALKLNPSTHPYPHRFDINTSLPSFIEKFKHIGAGEWLRDVSITVAGRVHSIRSAGSKLVFYDLCGEGVKIQVRATASEYDSEEAFAAENVHIRRGDVIGITGLPGRTKRGELSIIPSSVSQLHALAGVENDSNFDFRLNYCRRVCMSCPD